MTFEPTTSRSREVRSPDRPPTAAGPDSGKMVDVISPRSGGQPPHQSVSTRKRRGDPIFRAIVTAAGMTMIVFIALIAVFLLTQAIPSLRVDRANFLTSTKFDTGDAKNLQFGIRDLLVVTLLSSLFALLIAVPVAVSIAIFLTNYAPRSLSRVFGAVVDLLAAVPSIVFGLWGIFVLAPKLEPLATFLNDKLGWIPIFADGNVSLAGGGNILTASCVLAIMILPIITAITREVYRQTPSGHVEAAQALGATKWEVVRMTVLPFGRSGTIAASMLGLGRALGETVAVLIVLRTSSSPSSATLFDGGYTFASKIASASSEFNQPLPTGAYIAAGFVLFALTFVVNAAARAVAGGKVNG